MTIVRKTSMSPHVSLPEFDATLAMAGMEKHLSQCQVQDTWLQVLLPACASNEARAEVLELAEHFLRSILKDIAVSRRIHAVRNPYHSFGQEYLSIRQLHGLWGSFQYVPQNSQTSRKTPKRTANSKIFQNMP